MKTKQKEKKITASVKCFKSASWEFHSMFPCSHNIKVNEYLFPNYLLEALLSHLSEEVFYFNSSSGNTASIYLISLYALISNYSIFLKWKQKYTPQIDFTHWICGMLSVCFSVSFLLTPHNLFAFLTTRKRSVSVRLPNYRPLLTGNIAMLTWKVDGGLVKNSRRSVLTKGF